ncbi:MAG TPA: hypothetical protein VHE37_15895, partial [Nevskiaceae bacterium]|nr:hypothetical protein [Nevskiaceae bacterium]
APGRFAGSAGCGEVVDVMRTCASHILALRAGAALQPGARRYTRAWIRDATVMAAALLRMGRVGEVQSFIDWYAGFLRADGYVPCCVDAQGPDWTVEHDSHGQWLSLLTDHAALAADDACLHRHWPSIERAAQLIEQLLDASGLLPPSISHEGYAAQPVHAYWDDFWAIRGLQDAARAAQRLGRHPQAHRWTLLAGRIAAATSASIAATCARAGIDYWPGSRELADFDPTATASAVVLLDGSALLDVAALQRTYDRYMNDWRRRRSGQLDWVSYTPYEIRNIGALVRLGRRADAIELLEFFMAGRRPLRWNQWPEIAWRDVQAPAHVGDVPHGWVAAEFVLAARSLFLYERDADRCLVIAAGLPPAWLTGEGVRVTDAPTAYGPVSYRLQHDGRRLSFSGTFPAKVVRVELHSPLPVGTPVDISAAGTVHICYPRSAA